MPEQPLIPRLVAAGDRPTVRVIGELVTVRAVAADTGGAYALVEARTAPGGGAPPHRRRYDDVAYLVLDGVYAFQVEARAVELGPGGYAFVPRGTVHAYRNAGPTPARLLVLASPGGIHEQFVAEVGEPAGARAARPGPDGPPDFARLAAAAEKYGIEFAPPTGQIQLPPPRGGG